MQAKVKLGQKQVVCGECGGKHLVRWIYGKPLTQCSQPPRKSRPVVTLEIDFCGVAGEPLTGEKCVLSTGHKGNHFFN